MIFYYNFIFLINSSIAVSKINFLNSESSTSENFLFALKSGNTPSTKAFNSLLYARLGLRPTSSSILLQKTQLALLLYQYQAVSHRFILRMCIMFNFKLINYSYLDYLSYSDVILFLTNIDISVKICMSTTDFSIFFFLKMISAISLIIFVIEINYLVIQFFIIRINIHY